MNWIRLLAIGLMLALPGLAEAGTTTLHDAVTANATGKNIAVTDKGMLGLTVSISGTATLTVQGSADGGVTWTSFSCTPLAGGASSTTITASGQHLCPVAGLSHVQTPLTGCSACTVTVKALTSDAGGSSSGFTLDADGNLMVALGHTLAGEAVADDVLKVEQRGYYTSITTAATTVVKSGPGWFQGCKVLGGTLGNVTIYDNTGASGAVIAAAFTPTSSGDLFPLNTSFSVGLTVVTAAATNLTCVVR